MPINESIWYWLFSKMIQESSQPKKTSVILQLYKTPHVLIQNNYCKNNFGSQSCMQPPVLTKAQLMHSKNNVPSSPKYTKKTSTVLIIEPKQSRHIASSGDPKGCPVGAYTQERKGIDFLMVMMASHTD